MDETNEAAAPEPQRRWWAVLAEDGALKAWSESEIAGAPCFDTEPDLKIGKYRWVPGRQYFMPIMAEFKKTRPPADPDTLVAIALGFRALADQGLQLPEYTRGWLAGFERWVSDLPDDHEVAQWARQWAEHYRKA